MPTADSSHWRDVSASHGRRATDPELESRMRRHGQLHPAPSVGDHTDSGARCSPSDRPWTSAEHPSGDCTDGPTDKSSLCPGSGTAEPDVIG